MNAQTRGGARSLPDTTRTGERGLLLPRGGIDASILLNALPNPVLALDANNTIVDANGAAPGGYPGSGGSNAGTEFGGQGYPAPQGGYGGPAPQGGGYGGAAGPGYAPQGGGYGGAAGAQYPTDGGPRVGSGGMAQERDPAYPTPSGPRRTTDGY